MSRQNRTGTAATFDERQIEDIADRVFANFIARFEKKFDGKFKLIEEKLDKITTNMKDLQGRVQDNMNSIKRIENEINDIKSCRKKSTLRLDGIHEGEKEDILQVALTLINNKLNIKCTESDIYDIYRIGQHKGNRNRTVIMKFVSQLKRNSVYNAKKLLKGTGMFINEDLTKSQYVILKEAKKKYGAKQVWTVGGRILGKINNEVKMVNALEDL